jgi:hypothetical protein
MINSLTIYSIPKSGWQGAIKQLGQKPLLLFGLTFQKIYIAFFWPFL